MTKYVRFLIAFTLSLTVVSCGGGGGGNSAPPASQNAGENIDGGDSSSDGNNDDDNVPVSLNKGLKGTIYFGWIKDYEALDLETGIVNSLRSVSWGEGASPDGKEHVQIADGYTTFGPDTDLLIYFGTDGTGTSMSESPNNVEWIGPARISPDGKYTAVYWYYDKVYYDNATDGLAIMDRSGKVVQFIDGEYLNNWDWTPQNQLMFNDQDTIYRIDSVGNEPVEVTTVTDGYPLHLTISADGTQMLYTMWDDNRKVQDVYVMKVNGNDRVKVATTNTNKNAPAWSPDGKYIAIAAQTGASSVTWDCPSGQECTPMPPIESTCQGIYIVPLGGQLADLTSNNIAPAFAALRVTDKNKYSTITCAKSLSWRDTPTTLQRSMGTEPPGGGANNGLTGHLYIENTGTADEFMQLDLYSGNLYSIPRQYNSVLFPMMSASRDGQEIVFVDGTPDNNSYYEQQLKIERMDGTITSTFNLSQEIDGIPELSFDSQYILAYRNFDYKDERNGVRVYDRQGTEIDYLGGWGEWGWMPDNRIVLKSGGELYLTDASWSTSHRIASLPNGVSNIDVSPDGSKIAFAMLNHVWTIDIDGTGLKQLTTSAEREILPSWSPDGKFVAVKHWDGFDGSCQHIFIVPADGERVYVANDGVSSSTKHVWRQRGDGLYDFCQNRWSTPNWRP